MNGLEFTVQPDNCPIGYQGQHAYEKKIVANPFNIPIYHEVCIGCGKDKDNYNY